MENKKIWYKNPLFIIIAVLLIPLWLPILIIFSPIIFIILIWTKTKWSKTIKWVATITIIILSIIIISFADTNETNKNKPNGNNKQTETQKKSDSQTPTQTTQSATPTPTKEKTTMDKLWEALDASIQTRDKFDIEYSEGVKIVTITKQSNDSWDETVFVKVAYQEFVKYGLKAFQIDNVDKIIFKYYDNFIDSYGKELKDVGIRIEMTKDEFQKFNWQNLVGQNIYKQMQDYSWIHLGIQKNLKIDKITLLSL